MFTVTLILFLVLFIGCENHSKNDFLLQRALDVLDENPEQAYSILDSIKQPERLNEEEYAQYKLAFIEAKYKTIDDIAGDSAIVSVLEYFKDKGNSAKAAKAAYYAGAVYYENDIMDKALEYHLLATKEARRTTDFMLIGKAENNIGFIYFEQGLTDSAIVHLEQSLYHLDKVENLKSIKLKPLHTISTSHLVKDQLEQADKYIERGLKLTADPGYENSKAVFLNLKGVMLHRQHLYNDAKKYYAESLTKTDNIEDSVRYMLNFALLYNRTFQLDSAKYYINIVNKNIDASSSKKLALKNFYNLLSIYYKQIGETREALRYKELENKANEEIMRSRSVDKLIKANEKHTNALKDEQLKHQQTWLYVGWLTCLFLVMIIVCVYLYKRFQNQKLTFENSLLTKNNNLLESNNQLLTKDSNAINFLVGILKTIIAKDTALNQKLKILQETYQATEKPQIFVETEEMIASIEDLINEQLLIISKKYLNQKIPALLNDRETLYITLRTIGLNENEIYATPNFSGMEHEKFKMIKYRIRKKFRDSGMSDKSITLLLLSENSILLKDNKVSLLNIQKQIDEEKNDAEKA